MSSSFPRLSWRKNEPAQLTLGFDDDEKEQFRRDAEALRARVEAIPEEILAEEESIRRRYKERSARVFPASITFLVPKRMCDRGVGDVLRGPRAGRSEEPR